MQESFWLLNSLVKQNYLLGNTNKPSDMGSVGIRLPSNSASVVGSSTERHIKLEIQIFQVGDLFFTCITMNIQVGFNDNCGCFT